MFLKKARNILCSLLLISSILPIKAFAYSDYIIAGGENIGIQINSKGILIVGLYKVGNVYPGREAGLKLGDKILSINNQNVENINQMVEMINKDNDKKSIDIKYKRFDKVYNTKLSLIKTEDEVYKTGLYVKDTINGIGTLTFIDPNTKNFGALGHEIIEKNTGQMIEVKDGKIFKSEVEGITKSSNGSPGEKNAKYYSNITYGNIFENTSSGIFGTYNDIPNKTLYKVGKPDDIKIGKASILTVVKDEQVEEFDINIIKLNKDSSQKVKNILFSITDSKLLETTGGIIQGMSGSPIIQDKMIIGAVTHVIVDDPTKGYGIFITNMLEEAEN
ncbi:MAG TPA: SpoIVB peptidase [Mollicutes bacterium]|nr:SpoIVB peptidase [Mollicutes bacterium]